MNDKIVSVIVPIYNTKEYLPRCIESIQAQTYQNMEIILVDDGSTDGSGEVCDRYAAQDERIIVVHQTNQGNNAARKAGVRLARGEYVTFVDSDDWVETEYVKTMVKQMEDNDCDLVCSSVLMERKEGQYAKKNGIPAGIYLSKDIVNDLFYYKNTDVYGVLPYAYAKLYRRRQLLSNIESIDNQIRYAEDKALVFTYVYSDIKIYFSDEMHYHYCIRENSICQSQDADYMVKLTYFYQYAKELFAERAETPHLFHQLGHYLQVELTRALNYKLGLATPDNPIVKTSHMSGYEADLSVLLDCEKKIVIYGAGKVGRDYYDQLGRASKIEIIAWADRDYVQYAQKGFQVVNIMDVPQTAYDYVLVAVKKEEVFEEIKAELTAKGIVQKKIIWGKPCGVKER